MTAPGERQAHGPLAGVRVLDLTRLLPGPFCSLLLADFGADVIKVEDMGAGDYARWMGDGDGRDSDAAPFFVALNRNKRSIRLNLKAPEGRDLLLRLAAGSDVLLESFRPGVMARLGLGYDELLRANPRLVICPISGYGQEGPYRDRAGHDLNYLAVNGLLDLVGAVGEDPAPMPVQVADVGGGALMAAFGVMVALRHAERTGAGQVADVSMTHGSLAWLAPMVAELTAGRRPPARGEAVLAGGAVCYRVYACADGDVSLAALETKFWATFCSGVGRPDLLGRQFDPPGSPAHRDLQSIIAERTRAEWRAFADEHDCCLEPVATLAEALQSPALRDATVELEATSDAGPDVPPARVLGPPVRLTGSPADPHRRPVPGLGEHTDEILLDAGLTPPEIARLHARGVVAGHDPAGHAHRFMA